MARGVGGKGPANVMRHTKGISFPVSKSDLISHAKKGPGPDTDQVIEVLEQLPDQEYSTPAEILKAIGKKK